MAKPFALPDFKVPEFKFPKFDLDALFGVAEGQPRRRPGSAERAGGRSPGDRQGAVRLRRAGGGRGQGRLRQQGAAEARGRLQGQPATEKSVAAAKEVVDLAVAAQKRVYELVTQRTQATVAELKSVAA